jgi:hypothetical protein
VEVFYPASTVDFRIIRGCVVIKGKIAKVRMAKKLECMIAEIAAL